MKSAQENLSDAIHEGMRKIANSITPLGVGSGRDAAGGNVDSLTEACMGITSGLCRIAEAINNLTDSVSADQARVIVAAKERGSKQWADKQVVWPATKWPDDRFTRLLKRPSKRRHQGDECRGVVVNTDISFIEGQRLIICNKWTRSVLAEALVIEVSESGNYVKLLNLISGQEFWADADDYRVVEKLPPLEAEAIK